MTVAVPSSAIVRRPSPRLAEGEVTHVRRQPVDMTRALAQHAAYVDTLRSHGVRIVHAPPLDDHPDGVFVEDALVVLRDRAVLARPGAPSRRGEVDSLLAVVDALGLTSTRIVAPATLDGGDALVTDRHVFVGLSTRTNAEALDQFAPVVMAAVGLEVVGVPVTRCLHLKSAVTALPDGSLVAVSDQLDLTPFMERRYAVHVVDEPSGGDVLCLGATVVLPADAPRTTALLTALGFDVCALDLSELQKIEAGATCMSVLVP